MAGMNRLEVRVRLDEEGMGDLAVCMAAVPGFAADGRPRSWTMPEVLREALRRMAAHERGRK